MTRRTYTTEQVAEMYVTDAVAVRRWIRQGRLAAVNLGTDRKPNYRISDAALDRFERERTKAA